VGIFAFASRTYAGPSPAVWDAAVALHKAGLLKARAVPLGEALAGAYRAAGTIYTRADVTAGGDVLAMNFVLDRSAEGWAQDLARLRKQLGDCDTSAPITPTGQLSGTFTWRCGSGRLEGTLLLAPTHPPRIQSLELAPATP
jgi:hypothetical protein